MNFGRSHVVVLLVITFPILVGVFFGNRVAADAQTLNQLIAIPTTTDLRHPVAVYLVPPFLRTMPAILQVIGTTSTAEDRVKMMPPVEYGLGGQLVIERALPVTVMDAGTSTVYRTWVETAGDLLAEQKVEIGEYDRVDPAQETKLTLDQTIVITRVAITEVAQTQSISFTTKTEDDPARPKGEKKTVQKGVAGTKKLTYQVRRENGQEVSRKLIKTEQTKDPVEEIISIGTKPVISVKCQWQDYVMDAAAKNNIDPNALCYRMMRESNGNPNSDSGKYEGLFQYDPGLWVTVSAKAGYVGADIWDARAQVYVTAWAWAHGYRGRWPTP